jgi:hypothetical protein
VQTAIRTDPLESKLGYVRLKRVFAGREHGFAFAEDSNSIYSWGRCDSGQCARATDEATGAITLQCFIMSPQRDRLFCWQDQTLLLAEQPSPRSGCYHCFPDTTTLFSYTVLHLARSFAFFTFYADPLTLALNKYTCILTFHLHPFTHSLRRAAWCQHQLRHVHCRGKQRCFPV